MPTPYIPPFPLRMSQTVLINDASVAEHWNDIQQHKWFLSQRLGRDVGTRVAALDYLENIDNADRTGPPLPVTTRLRDYAAKLICLLAARPAAESPASILNFERVMSGTRSLAK